MGWVERQPECVKLYAVQLYRSHLPAKTVAKFIGVTERTIMRWVEDRGAWRQREHTVDWRRALELHRELGSYTKVGKVMGFHRSSIQRAIG